MTESSLGKQTPPSGAVPPAPAMRQVALATIELESHLTLPPTLHASYRRFKTTASMLFESVLEYRSPVAWVDLGTQESHRGDARCNGLF